MTLNGSRRFLAFFGVLAFSLAPVCVRAQQASAEQPWPVLQVQIDPQIGLTGLASALWLAGTPQMPDAIASAGPLTVTVVTSRETAMRSGSPVRTGPAAPCDR